MSKRNLKQLVVIYYILVAVIGLVGYATLFGDIGESTNKPTTANESTILATTMTFDIVSIKETVQRTFDLVVHKDHIDKSIHSEEFTGNVISKAFLGKEFTFNYSLPFTYEVDLDNIDMHQDGNTLYVDIPKCTLCFQNSSLEVVGRDVGWLRQNLKDKEKDQIQDNLDKDTQIEVMQDEEKQKDADDHACVKLSQFIEDILATGGCKDAKVRVRIKQ